MVSLVCRVSELSNDFPFRKSHVWQELEKVHFARNMLSLPMSRRERLQLTNKERARTERRARAKKRREEMMGDLEGVDPNAGTKGLQKSLSKQGIGINRALPSEGQPSSCS